MFLKNRNIISKIKRSKVTDYAALNGHLNRRPKIGIHDPLSLNAGQKYCRMLHGEHPAILSTFVKLPLAIKIFVLSLFEWSLKTGFTVIFHMSTPLDAGKMFVQMVLVT